MRNPPVPYARVTPRTATSTANSAIAITLAAVEGETHVLHAIQCGYDSAPTGGTITVTIGGTTVFSEYVSTENEDWEFPQPIYGESNKEMVITLGAGGGTAIGKLNVQTS